MTATHRQTLQSALFAAAAAPVALVGLTAFYEVTSAGEVQRLYGWYARVGVVALVAGLCVRGCASADG